MGVAVVVIAVHFMTSVFTPETSELLALGVGSGAAIASLGLFAYLRALSEKLDRAAAADQPESRSPVGCPAP